MTIFFKDYYFNYLLPCLLSLLEQLTRFICILLCLTMITIISFKFYYMHYICFKYNLHYCNYGNKIIAILRLSDSNSNDINFVSPVHKSGIWLQILVLTAGMNSYTSEAAMGLWQQKYC